MNFIPKYVVTQKETDDMVRRVKALVVKYGGGSEKLKSLRTLYGMFHARAEHSTLACLQSECDKLEAEA